MVQFGESQSTIAKYVGVSQPTISKELSRNSMIKGKYKKKRYYAPKKAQWKADSRKHRFVLPRKFDKEMAHYVYERLVYHEWSPEQIVGTAKTEGRDMVSVERIYQYIRMDRAANGNVYKHCRHKLKHRRRVLNASASNIPNRVSIHSRPSEVEKRERVGDWEMDLIQGINGTFILTLVERKTRYLDMCRLPCGKKSDQMAQMAQMAQMVCARLSSYKGKVLTITTDNGSEFSKHEYIS